jgi:hypothetical protein
MRTKEHDKQGVGVNQGSYKKLGDEFPKGSGDHNKHRERKVDNVRKYRPQK